MICLEDDLHYHLLWKSSGVKSNLQNDMLGASVFLAMVPEVVVSLASSGSRAGAAEIGRAHV